MSGEWGLNRYLCEMRFINVLSLSSILEKCVEDEDPCRYSAMPVFNKHNMRYIMTM